MRETIFFLSLGGFVVAWGTMAVLYLTMVLPVVVRERGLKSIFEAALQFNLAGHLSKYREVARTRGNGRMMVVWYAVNVLIVMGTLAFLAGVLSTIEL